VPWLSSGRIFAGAFVYKGLSVEDLWAAAEETMVEMGAFVAILATAAIYSFVIISAGIPDMLLNMLMQVGPYPRVQLLIIFLIVIVLELVLEPLANLTLLVPIFAPNFAVMGIDPIHAGVVIVLGLMIGMLTPPIGPILFVLEKITGIKQEEIIRELLPSTFLS